MFPFKTIDKIKRIKYYFLFQYSKVLTFLLWLLEASVPVSQAQVLDELKTPSSDLWVTMPAFFLPQIKGLLKFIYPRP